MGLPVSADNPCPVYTKYHRQIRNTDIMNDLIVGPLKEGGINRHIGFQASRCQTSRKSYRMFFTL